MGDEENERNEKAGREKTFLLPLIINKKGLLLSFRFLFGLNDFNLRLITFFFSFSFQSNMHASFPYESSRGREYGRRPEVLVPGLDQDGLVLHSALASVEDQQVRCSNKNLKKKWSYLLFVNRGFVDQESNFFSFSKSKAVLKQKKKRN